MPASNAPETTRQRMIGLMYIILLCMLALNVSSEVLSGFELVDDSLTSSAQNTNAKNKVLYKDFEAYYKTNPEKTREWYMLAQDLRRRSDALYNYIDTLKWKVVRECDGKDADIHNIRKSDDLDAAAKIMLPPTGREARKLKRAIADYRDHIVLLVNDSLKRKIIMDNFSTQPSKRAKRQGHNWDSSMFENMPVGAVITMFTKLQNDIRYAEGEVLHTLTNNIDVGDFRVNQIKAYVIPSSENVVRGGAFRANIVLSAEDSTQQPRVFVNGRLLDPRKKGLYEVTAGKSGVFPVEGYIETKLEDGSVRHHKFSRKYTVVEPMATVSNTMMNVLYAGINNKVSISVPGVPGNQISASINNGSLTRSGYDWIARPTATIFFPSLFYSCL